MNGKKFISIVGARPQFVKIGVLVKALDEAGGNATHTIIHSGQHFDANMSDVFFNQLEMPRPKYHLGIGGGTHGQNTGRMIEAIEAVLLADRPDCVLVYGDTDTTLAGALAASKLHIAIAHIEAGLRSWNRKMPEETNRILVDHMSSLLFTPTTLATKNLYSEGIPAEWIVQVGDVMHDAAVRYRTKAVPPRGMNVPKKFILATLHRAENTDSPERLDAIISALSHLCNEVPVVLPIHPRTRAKLMNCSIGYSGVTLIDPVGYFEMLYLLDHCQLVITDSGGLQKEAYFFKKPCITTRDETEWEELVFAGVNVLVGADRKRIIDAALCANFPADVAELYGDGRAGLSIVEALKKATI